MKILDLFCCAGGCGMGYHRAGFEVVGVDIKPQPRYPFEFHQGDALEYCREHWREFDAIHASPPCQKFSAMTKRWAGRSETHPDLIEPTRELLRFTGLPFVIENVVGAPLRDAFMLCGTMFRLETSAGNQLQRHRIFEAPWFFGLIPPCNHNNISSIGVYGGGQNPARQSHYRSKPDTGADFGINARREAMGIDWMTGKELNQAIPPAYTEFIGQHLMAHILERVAA